jgi:hypothetical protein
MDSIENAATRDRDTNVCSTGQSLWFQLPGGAAGTLNQGNVTRLPLLVKKPSYTTSSLGLRKA